MSADISYIVNPSAGNCQAADKWKQFCRNSGIQFSESHFTNGRDDISSKSIDAVKRKVQKLVICGGDGTLHQALQSLMSSADTDKLPQIVFLPGGTGCDFARAFDIPSDFDQWTNILKFKKSQLVDLGKIKWQSSEIAYFATQAAVGITATIGLDANKFRSRVFNPLKYTLYSLKHINTYNSIDYKVTGFADEIAGKFLTLLVANSAFSGNGVNTVPNASATDGILDLLTIKDIPLLRRYKSFIDLKLARHTELPEVNIRTCADIIKISTNTTVPWVVDGEIYYSNDAEFSVLKHALEFITPH